MDMHLTPATVLALQEAAEAFLIRLFEAGTENLGGINNGCSVYVVKNLGY